MTAKAALCKALLDGRVLNVKNVVQTIGLTNIAREIPRLVEKPFGVEVSRTDMDGRSRYGSRVSWTNYKLDKKNPYNADGIQKMREYVEKKLSSVNPKTSAQEKTLRKAGVINSEAENNLSSLLNGNS